MRIIVTQKGSEILRGEIPVDSNNMHNGSSNIMLLQARINNFKNNFMFNRSNFDDKRSKQKGKSFSIREVDKSIFNTPYYKKEKKIQTSPPRKDIINNLKSLANFIKLSENDNITQIVKKESVSPIFMKKLGIFNQNKIKTLKKIENKNLDKLVCRYKYNIFKS
jgi:hypothetical protein